MTKKCHNTDIVSEGISYPEQWAAKINFNITIHPAKQPPSSSPSHCRDLSNSLLTKQLSPDGSCKLISSSSPPILYKRLANPISIYAFPSQNWACAVVSPEIFKHKMEANRGQGGIQQLLAAEQEAQHIVNAARNAKMARLKQAKEEADKEIAEFRAQMEAEFQKKLAESSGDSGANVKRLELETEAKIQHLKSEAARISHDVVQMLLKHVTTVKN
ncbi:hypothetical protein MRB53_015977 [Persea americana]|uniref:Uncharacterized protein n=1 Tax=Persea americana TaxID=3435 RepID=A0ACC2M1K0_PERAE|nr:hypothetical protein MRB53_015977 [Persea americana]